MPPRPFLLAAALDRPEPTPDPGGWRDAALAAERAGLDFVTVEPGPADPLLVAARLAAQTARIGILPVQSTTTTEPFHVSTALATIDVVSRGRAGWLLTVDDPAQVRGTVTWDVPDDAVGDAAEHLEAVRALWDSWEDGAVIRDVAADRFLDRERVHHVHFRGTHLAVRGPSITPRPPQGHPVVAVRATDATTLALAEAHADLVVAGEDKDTVPAAGQATPGRPGAGGPARILEVTVRPGDAAALAERLVARHADGLAGALLHAADLPGVLAVLVPALERAGLRPGAGLRPADGAGSGGPSDPGAGTLRERLGLAPATNRFEVPA